jgi:hypothetical protein
MKAQHKAIKDNIIKNIRLDMADFGLGELELIERVTVKLDTDQFNYKEDESVWMQKRGKAPFVFICDLHEHDTHLRLMKKFLKGFLKGYESGRIRLNRFLAIIEAEKEAIAVKEAKEAEIKAIESLPQSTPEEKIAKDIVKEIAKENNA